MIHFPQQQHRNSTRAKSSWEAHSSENNWSMFKHSVAFTFKKKDYFVWMMQFLHLVKLLYYYTIFINRIVNNTSFVLCIIYQPILIFCNIYEECLLCVLLLKYQVWNVHTVVLIIFIITWLTLETWTNNIFLFLLNKQHCNHWHDFWRNNKRSK